MDKTKKKVLGCVLLLLGTIGILFDQYISFIKDEKYKEAVGLITSDREENRLNQEEKDVHIFAPLGCKVFLDNKPVSYEKERVYKATRVSEGKHSVQIEYPTKEKKSISYSFDVPETTELTIQYEPHEVSVEVAKGLSVVLAGYKQKSINGEVVFDHVMTGDYILSVYDEEGDIVPIEKNMSVRKEKENITIGELQLSEQGTYNIKAFLMDFYKDYLNGIKKGDSNFLEAYTVLEQGDSLKKDFDEWFVAHKEIEDVKLEIELEAITMQADGRIKVELLENAKLINKEENSKEQIEYLVTLNWITFLEKKAKNYYITERIIDESLVSYKDKEGNWIQY